MPQEPSARVRNEFSSNTPFILRDAVLTRSPNGRTLVRVLLRSNLDHPETVTVTVEAQGEEGVLVAVANGVTVAPREEVGIEIPLQSYPRGLRLKITVEACRSGVYEFERQLSPSPGSESGFGAGTEP